MTITALPQPPSRQDPTNFSARADAFLGALPTFATEANALASDLNNTAATATAATAASQAAAAASAASALSAQQLAEIAANAAGQAANASQWVSGFTYALGDVVWSPLNFLLYRRKSAGSSTTDPSLDQANWALIGSPLAAPQQVISSNTLAISGTHYIITASLTLTLPANPSNRDVVLISNLSATTTVVIARNGSRIMQLEENLTLDVVNAVLTLVYVDATRGWIFI